MGTRATIGLYIADVADEFRNSLCRGAFSAAKEEDVSLLVFPGKYLRRHCQEDSGQICEYQHNTFYSYCYEEGIDLAVVNMGSMLCRADNGKIRSEFLKRFREIPVLAVASDEDSCSYIKYDNRTGIRDAVRFLCREKRCSHIAMAVSGAGNDDIYERLNAYKDSLMENSLPVEDELIAYGDLTDGCTEPVQQMLRHRPDIEAVICSDEAAAEGVYEAVRGVGRTIGRDIYVVGFDGMDDCCRMTPPLASIGVDVSRLGYESIKTACRMLREKRKIQIVLKTKFEPRESVGYQPYDLHGGLAFLHDLVSRNADLKSVSSSVTDFIFHEPVWDYQAEYQKKLLCTFFQKLFDRYFDGLMKRSSAEDIYIQFRNMALRGMMGYVEPAGLFRLFDVLYQIFCVQNKTMTERLEFHNLLEKFRQCIMDGMSAGQFRAGRKHAKTYHATNVITRDILLFGGGSEESYREVLDRMKPLGMKNGYLYIWEEPQECSCEEVWHAPEYVLLKVFQKDGELVKIPRVEQKMRTCDSMRNPYFDREKRFTYLVIDIYSKSQQLGFYLCDLEYENLHYAEFLTYQLSAAVHLIQLYQRQWRMHKELEESREQLKANHMESEVTSMSDERTGLLNRHGFMCAAQKLIDDAKACGQAAVIVGCADMDNLKDINGFYGHEEGDSAIRAAAGILEETFGTDGIVGHMGGDAFAVILPQDKKGDEKRYRRVLEEVTESTNKECAKSYRIQLSMGIGEFACREDMEIKAMLEEAGDLLYKEKKERKERSAE